RGRLLADPRLSGGSRLPGRCVSGGIAAVGGGRIGAAGGGGIDHVGQPDLAFRRGSLRGVGTRRGVGGGGRTVVREVGSGFGGCRLVVVWGAIVGGESGIRVVASVAGVARLDSVVGIFDCGV